MADVAFSRTGTPIRLTDERWRHIVAGHPELADLRSAVLQTIAAAAGVVLGADGAHIAFRFVEPRKALVVVYREVRHDDGFVITAFLTRRLAAFERRTSVWPPKN